MEKESKIVIECKLKETLFVSEEPKDESLSVEVEQETKSKIFHILDLSFGAIGRFFEKMAPKKEISPPLPHLNDLNEEGDVCRKVFETLGYQHVVFSRTDTFQKTDDPRVKGPRESVGFQFYIPHELQITMIDALTKINDAIRAEETLTDRFDINIFEA